MKNFFKALLIVALVVVALKLSPVIFAAALAGVGAALLLGTIGLSVVAVLFGVLLLAALVLSPVWVPILAICGLIGLFRKSRPVPAVVAV